MKLAETTRWDNAKFFKSIDEVFVRTVTMDLATIMEARKILFTS